jgi:hypothetical protein
MGLVRRGVDGIVTRPTQFGPAQPIIGGLGFDPDAQTEDVEPPQNMASEENGGQFHIPVVSGELLVVQSATGYATGTSVTVNLPANPTIGNLLVAWLTTRNELDPPGPTDWTAHPDGWAVPSGTQSGSMFYKTVEASDTASITGHSDSATSGLQMSVAEIAGAGTLVADAELEGQNGDDLALDLTSSGSGDMLIIGGFVVRVGDGGGPHTVAPLADSTELIDTETNANSPLHWLGYRIVTSPSGAYTIGGTCSQAGRDWAGQALAFELNAGGIVWVTGPLAIDDDDDTFEYIA